MTAGIRASSSWPLKDFILPSLTATTRKNLPPERQGDFSELLATGICAAKVNGIPVDTIIKNPATGLPYPGNIINSPLSTVDQQLLTVLYPMPTQAGCGINTFEHVDRDQPRHPLLGPSRP